MAREDRNADRRRDPQQGGPQGPADGGQTNGNWYGGERENEFGGEPRFRAEGGHGSHFGGEPEALGATETRRSEHRNTKAWLGERRRKFMEKFDRWRRERAARTAKRGPDSGPAESAPPTGRHAKK